jgi:hypothetical protein
LRLWRGLDFAVEVRATGIVTDADGIFPAMRGFGVFDECEIID